MALEHLFRNQNIIKVIHTLWANRGYTLFRHEIAKDAKITEDEVREVIKVLTHYEMLDRTDEEGDFSYSFDKSNKVVLGLIHFMDDLNIYQYRKEKTTSNEWERQR